MGITDFFRSSETVPQWPDAESVPHWSDHPLATQIYIEVQDLRRREGELEPRLRRVRSLLDGTIRAMVQPPPTTQEIWAAEDESPALEAEWREIQRGLHRKTPELARLEAEAKASVEAALREFMDEELRHYADDLRKLGQRVARIEALNAMRREKCGRDFVPLTLPSVQPDAVEEHVSILRREGWLAEASAPVVVGNE